MMRCGYLSVDANTTGERMQALGLVFILLVAGTLYVGCSQPLNPAERKQVTDTCEQRFNSMWAPSLHPELKSYFEDPTFGDACFAFMHVLSWDYSAAEQLDKINSNYTLEDYLQAIGAMHNEQDIGGRSFFETFVKWTRAFMARRLN